MARTRLFTNEFKVGDRVYVIREKHGWHDGSIVARVTALGDEWCVVCSEEDGAEIEIEYPRDIRKAL